MAETLARRGILLDGLAVETAAVPAKIDIDGFEHSRKVFDLIGALIRCGGSNDGIKSVPARRGSDHGRRGQSTRE